MSFREAASPRLSRALSAVAVALLLGGSAGCHGGREPATGDDVRSAVLITLDTTRADALSCYGTRPGITPHLDAFAAECVLYANAHTVAPITLPAHASMLTGLYPLRHSVRENGLNPLPASAHTLAEAARAAGHQTAAFISTTVLDAAYGMEQGFDVFVSPERVGQVAAVHSAERTGETTAADAIRWLEGRDRTRPFFLWVHFFDPHAPYVDQPAHEEVARANGPYYGEVAAMDDAVGELLDALRREKVLDQGTVLVVADHGEGLMEHREDSHSFFCYETTLRVPFLLRHPDGRRAGERSEEVVSVVDVFPTLADAMQLAVADDIDGESLLRRTVPGDRGVYFETYSGYINFGWSPLPGWLDARGKYIGGTVPEFYAVASDPREEHDLIAEGSADVGDYVRGISEVASRTSLPTAAATEASRALLEKIRSLGYAASGLPATEMPHPLQRTGLPSPVKRIDDYYKCMQAMQLMGRKAIPQATALLEEVLAQNPRNWLARDRIAACFMEGQAWAKALPHLAYLVQEGPQRAETYINLARCLQLTGRLDEAIAALRRAVELDPGEPAYLEGLARMLALAGRRAEAEEAERRLRELRAGG